MSKKVLSFILLCSAVSCGLQETASFNTLDLRDNKKQKPLLRISSGRVISCPEVDHINAFMIPSSIHAIFTAKSDDGTEFMGFNLGIIDAATLKFTGAGVVKVNDRLALVCEYQNNIAHLLMESGSDLKFHSCEVAGEVGKKCTKSIKECQFSCEISQPPAP